MKFTPPIRRVDTAKSHHYVDAEGRRVPGVTTCTDGGIPKPKLIAWAGNATADYAVDHWEELAALPPSERNKRLRGARYEARDAARAKGTAIHGYAADLIMGHAVDVPEGLVGYVEAYSRWLQEFDVKPVHVEFSVVSYKWGYAGTGDLIASLDIPHVGRVTELIDLKSNKTGIFGETALQDAGYRYADVLILKDGTEIPMPEVDGCAAVHIRPDGCDHIPVTADPDQHRQFLYAKAMAEFVALAPDLIGPPTPPPTTSTYRLVRENTR